MSDLQSHYEAFPYPSRRPEDEDDRLITGSPSCPLEMDHLLWGGRRDWSEPLRTLVAGGGTGDGLIQLAQKLTDAGCSYEIVYVDLSETSRRIAQARAERRGLKNIRFITGSFLDHAPKDSFDYIDCCGVLHHMENASEALTVLQEALRPDGGLGFMVYAPYGRFGLYPVQQAFRRMFGHLPPSERLAKAREAFARLPASHPLLANSHLQDFRRDDAGFFDSLLHEFDSAYSVRDLFALLEQSGLRLASFAHRGLYELERLVPDFDLADACESYAITEELRGTIKQHVGYARRKGALGLEREPLGARVPHLNGVAASELAQAVGQGLAPVISIAGEDITLQLPQEAALLLEQIDGKSDVAKLARRASLGEEQALELWREVERVLEPWGLLFYSRLNV